MLLTRSMSYLQPVYTNIAESVETFFIKCSVVSVQLLMPLAAFATKGLRKARSPPKVMQYLSLLVSLSP